MRVITAVEDYEEKLNDVKCFLAGGITNCPNWQKEVIEYLDRYPENMTEHLVLFNPRRENFPIHDPNASEEQIKWEFKYLESMDIFSMYFTSGISDQPICMYELGRNLVRMYQKNPYKCLSVVSVEDGYKRKNDVVIQTGLTETMLYLNQGENVTPELHAKYIQKIYESLVY